MNPMGDDMPILTLDGRPPKRGPRPCDNCHHDLRDHMEAEPGYAKPCQKQCSCTSFSDEQERADVKKLNIRAEKGPAGYVK